MNLLYVYLVFSAMVALAWVAVEMKGCKCGKDVARMLMSAAVVGLCAVPWVMYAVGVNLCLLVKWERGSDILRKLK